MSWVKNKILPVAKKVMPAITAAYPAAAPYALGAMQLVNLFPSMANGNDPVLETDVRYNILMSCWS